MEKEEYAIVLDYLPNGYPLEKKMIPIVQAIGEKDLTLLELVPRSGTNFEIGERVYIGEGKRDKVYYILGRLSSEKIFRISKNTIGRIYKENCKGKRERVRDFFQ